MLPETTKEELLAKAFKITAGISSNVLAWVSEMTPSFTDTPLFHSLLSE